MHREIVDWSTSNISAQVSSVMLLSSYPQASISVSRRVSPRGGGCGSTASSSTTQRQGGYGLPKIALSRAPRIVGRLERRPR
jgi:hypothetical protein